MANPDLLKLDLAAAEKFSQQAQDWSYITNTRRLYLANPWNLKYLKEVKKLKHLKEIVIYAPNPMNRVLLKLVRWLIKPDRIIKDQKEFHDFLVQRMKEQKGNLIPPLI